MKSTRKMAPRHRKRSAGKGSEDLWIFGTHAVRNALANPRRQIHQLLATREAMRALDATDAAAGIPAESEVVDRSYLEQKLPKGTVHQGIAARVSPLPPLDIDAVLGAGATLLTDRALVLVLDQITDPHNVGAIVRSAAAFDVDAIITPTRHTATETGTLAKAASGALELVPNVAVPNLARALQQLGRAGFWRIGLDSQADLTLGAAMTTGPIALVLGAEGRGLRRLTRESCDALARLPISDRVDSLNVSNAAAIALYEVRRPADDGP